MENDYKNKLDSFADRLKKSSKPTPIQEVRPLKNHTMKTDKSEKIIRATVHLPARIHKKIKLFCAKNDISFKDYVTEVLSKSIEKK